MKSFQKTALSFLALALGSIAIVAAAADTPNTVEPAQEKKWVCTIENPSMLISSYYDGGKYANIHLAPYSHGGSYRVVRENNVAKGVTANGTAFVCKYE